MRFGSYSLNIRVENDITVTVVKYSESRHDVTGERKRGKLCGMYKTCGTKILFQLLNQLSVDFIIITLDNMKNSVFR